MYHAVAVDCFRRYGFTSFDQVDRLTIAEYNIIVEAERLKMIDEDYRNHLQAYLTFRAQGMKKSGKYGQKPVFKTFRSFYDYEKEIKKAEEKPRTDSRFVGLSRFLKKQRGN